MQEYIIEAKKRTGLGKKETVALRNEKRVPCVLYGAKEPIHFHAEEMVMEKLVNTPNVYIANINIDGKVEKAILQDMQFHALTDKILHADFLSVFADKAVSVKLPVKLEGTPEGVLQGGKLQMKMRKLKVRGITEKLPEFLTIDITNVGLGQSVKIEKLSFDGVEILEPKNAVVCAVKLTRSSVKTATDGK
ncbi:MAG: 50S ribosomal protein L25/general stress protein Ctc [Bacteroidales bacterium]|nr:50S ribosomal protein L25/general stress protein Ctc [Bacteroidales bacterium]